MELSEFLLARITEDEDEARRGVGWADRSTRWGRVLAECEAKRRIVELHQPRTFRIPVTDDPEDYRVQDGPAGCSFCDEAASLGVQWPCLHLCLLTLPYAEHPDYRAEWALDHHARL